MKRFFCLIIFCLTGLTFAWSQSDNFAHGEELFRRNKPDEAIPFLEEAVSKGENPKAYVYLVVAYYQIGHYEESLNIADRGMRVTGSNKKIIAYNAGNAAFLMQDYRTAEQWYSKALSADPAYANAVLNRANARISLEKYNECIEDYSKFLELAPDDYRHDDIVALLAKLQVMKEEEEARRIAQEKEEQRIKEEEERYRQEEIRYQTMLLQQQAEEAQRAAIEKAAKEAAIKAAEEEAEARRRKLMEEVAASLQDAETENMSAGAESTFDYDYESELE